MYSNAWCSKILTVYIKIEITTERGMNNLNSYQQEDPELRE